MKAIIASLGLAWLVVLQGQAAPRYAPENNRTTDENPEIDETITLTTENIPRLEKQKELRRKRNMDRRGEEAWDVACRATERIYGSVLRVLKLDDAALGRLKILLTERTLAATDVREAAEIFPNAPNAVPDGITEIQGDIDDEIARLVGRERADMVREMVALQSRLAFVQSRFADDIAKEATPLTPMQVLSLARVMAEVQEPLLRNPDQNVLYRASIVGADGLSDVDREILARAVAFLTEPQVATFRRLIVARNHLFQERQKNAQFLERDSKR